MAGHATVLDYRRHAAFFPYQPLAQDRTRLPTRERAPVAPGVPMGEGGVDTVLADSFPASDPPSWTPAVAATAARNAAVPDGAWPDTPRPGAFDPPSAGRSQPKPAYVTLVGDPGGRIGVSTAVASLAATIGVVLLVPLGIAVIALLIMSAWGLVRGQLLS
jgi:hypothetical protein